MSIDVRSWHREGRLRAGQCFLHTLTWNWRPTEGIAVLAKTDAVYLMFRSRSWPGEYGPTITQRIPIAWTPCTLGGRRPWFRCEAYSNGKYIRRVRKIRMRLGAGFSFAEPFPEKPPGMHWRTYLRMRVAAGESIAIYDRRALDGVIFSLRDEARRRRSDLEVPGSDHRNGPWRLGA
jgi:hypothetical protein